VIAGIIAIGFGVQARDVSFKHHPNLAAAQEFIEKAVNKISEAQKANEYDMHGHAARAKELLDQAYDEVKLAANEKK
jgi:hypothetical protein